MIVKNNSKKNKKTIPVMLILIMCLFFTSGCQSSPNSNDIGSDIDFKQNTEHNLSLMNEPYAVWGNDKMIFGNNNWKNFIDSVKDGNYTKIKLAFFYDYPERQGLYTRDISYDNDMFVIKTIDNGKMNIKEYSYMKIYEENVMDANTKLTYYVLTNDNTLTWDVIKQSVFSSTLTQAIDCNIICSEKIEI